MNNLDLEYTEGIFPGTREELVKKVKESVKGVQEYNNLKFYKINR